MRAPWMAAALLALAASAPAHAQPCGTRTGGAPTLTAGQTVRGALAREDFTLPGDRYNGTDACTGRPYDSFFYEAQAGERLTFVLESRQIDPSITATTHWRGGGTKDVVEQRGRRGRTLTATGVVPATGRILIQVESNVSLGRRGSTGDYTFTLRSDRPAGPPANTGGAVLRPGQRVSGELGAADGKLDDLSHFDDYSYPMRRGDRITVTLRSDDFDAFLHAGRRTADGSLENNQTDDDGGGGTDARVEYTADRDGPVTIRVNTLGEGETGRYTLELETGGAQPAPVDENASSGGGQDPAAGLIALQLGRPVRGELAEGDGRMDDGSFHDDYTYRARRGERLVIRLESADFDAVLAVMGIGANGQPENPAADDDGGGGTNARVEYTVQSDGPLLIRANTLAGGETGHYTLVVEAADRGTAAPAPDAAERVADRTVVDQSLSDRSAAAGGRTGLAGPAASGSLSFASAPRSFGADRLNAQAAHSFRAPAFAPRRADPILSRRATAWLMAGVGVGMIVAGAAIEDTPAEPVGALIRYTGYAVVVFAPFSGDGG